MPLLLSKIKLDKNMETREQEQYEAFSWPRVLPVLLSAGAGALALELFHVPAGILVGTVIGAGAATQTGKVHLKMSRRLQLAVQILIGGTVGTSITIESIPDFGHYLVPILVLNVLILSGSLLLAFLYLRLGDWSRQTCILSASPAGLSPTIMLALEYHADPVIVTLFQVTRMVSVLITVPPAAWLL